MTRNNHFAQTDIESRDYPISGKPVIVDMFCEGCGVQVTLFPDALGCRFLMEVQGA